MNGTDTVRIAVCQLECHPALVVGDRTYLGEPFVLPKDDIALADLARYTIDVTDLQRLCQKSYEDWHSRRVQQILSWLAMLTPVPDIIVFPECSIPIHDLYVLKSFAEEHDCAVFAGTHTLCFTDGDKKQYNALGVSRKHLRRWKELAGNTILPILTADTVLPHVKHVPSVFERTDASERTRTPLRLSPVTLRIRNRTITVLPLVCAEALQITSCPHPYDLLIIVAYNDGIRRFEPVIEHSTQNQIPVVFCNDGRFGQSSIHVVIDDRMSGIWWWRDPVRGLLPKGEAILVTDVHLDALAVQTAVANPSQSAHLVRVSPVVYDANFDPSAVIDADLAEIRSIEDNLTQVELLEQLMSRNGLSPLQKLLLPHLIRLARAGSASPQQWDILATSCRISALSTLRTLEATLARTCSERVERIIACSSSADDVTLGKLVRFKRTCDAVSDRDAPQRRAQEHSSWEPGSCHLDRERECQEVREFLDHPSLRVLLMTGLDEVGKETVVRVSIDQSGRKEAKWIHLPRDASAGFIRSALWRHLGLPVGTGGYREHYVALSDESVIDRIPQGTTIVLNHAENLLDHGLWRDSSLPIELGRFADALGRRRSKLIVLSAVRLDLQEIEPSHIMRRWLTGLPLEAATVFLDQNMRRAGLDPSHYDLTIRKHLAQLVGGHPGALILIAECIEEHGCEQVYLDLKTRRGVHSRIVRRILQKLSFSEEENIVLALLGEAREPIPIDVLQKSGIRNPHRVVRTLLDRCVVERKRYDHIVLAELIRGFANLPTSAELKRQLFHKAAAERFANLAGNIESPQQLAWAVESRYHATLAGDPNLAADVGHLEDGLVGAIRHLLDCQEYERAQPIVDRLLSSTPSAELYELGALVYARLGKCDEALTLAREAFSLDGHRTWVVSQVGRLALHVHRTDISQECIQLLRKSGHDNPYLATLEGRIALRNDDNKAALVSFRRAVALADAEHPPRDAWPHFYLGRALLKMAPECIEEAIEVLCRGADIVERRRTPNRKLLIAIRTQLAIAYVFDKNLDGAKRMLDLITADDRGNPEVIWALALYRATAGDEGGDASSLAQQTLEELNPRSARDRHGRCQVYLFRALIYLGVGNAERASEEFSKAHQEDPRNVFVILRWANTLVDLARQADTEEEHRAARSCAERAKMLADKVMEFDPGNREATRLLELLSDEFNVL